MSEEQAQPDPRLRLKIIGREADAVALAAAFFVHVHGRCFMRPACENFVFQRRHPQVALPGPGLGRFRHCGNRCLWHKGLVDGGVLFVLGQLLKDPELLRLQRLLRAFIKYGHRVCTLELTLEPMESAIVQRLQILMRPFGHLQADLTLNPEQRVDPAHVLINAENAINRENAVLVRVADQQRPRSHQRHEAVIVPAVGVHVEHAVAVTLDAAIDDVIVHRRHPCRRGRRLDALIQCRHPPRVGSSATASGHSKTCFVHLGPGFQIIQCPHPRPGFQPGRCVAA